MARRADKRKSTGQDETTTRNKRCKYWTPSTKTNPKKINKKTKEVSYLCMLEYNTSQEFSHHNKYNNKRK